MEELAKELLKERYGLTPGDCTWGRFVSGAQTEEAVVRGLEEMAEKYGLARIDTGG